MTRTFLIDTDTASDDAVALIMALRAPDVDVRALTIVSGNVDVQQGVRNALTHARALWPQRRPGLRRRGQATAARKRARGMVPWQGRHG